MLKSDIFLILHFGRQANGGEGGCSLAAPLALLLTERVPFSEKHHVQTNDFDDQYSVECGKFKLKQAFQSGKILACTKKSEIRAISTLKLIKMMVKCQVAQASSMCMLYYNLIRQF